MVLKSFPSRLVTVVEHPLKPGRDEPTGECPAKHSERKEVIHLIPQDCPPLAIIEEKVAMIPRGERTVQLGVGKQPTALVLRVLRHPVEGKRSNPAPENRPTAGEK